MMPVRLEPATLRSRVKHSTTKPLHSLFQHCSISPSVDSDEPVLPPFKQSLMKLKVFIEAILGKIKVVSLKF